MEKFDFLDAKTANELTLKNINKNMEKQLNFIKNEILKAIEKCLFKVTMYSSLNKDMESYLTNKNYIITKHTDKIHQEHSYTISW